jgi:NAD(P)-dependent dehydrogenase (short-subunit alcohol dehydrogenase family)
VNAKPAALLVGANGGMGRAVAQALLDADYALAATVSRQAAIDPFLADYPSCKAVEAVDLSDAVAVRKRIAGLSDQLERIDAVVVCSAIAPCAPAEMVAIEEFRRTIEINCTSALAIYQATIPHLRKTGGRFVLTGSYSGKVATPVMASYVASKFALEGLTDVLRQEAKGWDVEIVLIQPGALDTQMMHRTQEDLGHTIANLSPEQEDRYGDLYRQMKYRADEALANGTYSSPQAAAAGVLQALQDNPPSTRYAIGDDARSMLNLAKTCSDREIDTIILDIYRSPPV